MAIGPNNTIYVASFLNDKVVKFSIPDGKFLGVVSHFFLYVKMNRFKVLFPVSGK